MFDTIMNCVVLAGLAFVILYLIIRAVRNTLSERVSDTNTVLADATPAEEEKTACCEAPGNVKLIKVDDKTAAMLMAIVADSLNVAPERLHFEYIKLLED